MAPVLVIAPAGAVGAALVDALARAGHELALREPSELDRDSEVAPRALGRLRPRAIVDCTEAGRRPADGGAAGALAATASRLGALSVHLSDARVFDGRRAGPYVESDRPEPATPAGGAALAAERAVARANPRHAIVRTSWLFGARGPSFVEELVEACRQSDRVPVDAGCRGTPTYAGHLAEGIAGLLRRPAYGVFHAATGACSRLQFARALFAGLGLDCEPVPLDAAGEELPGRRLVLASRRRDGLRLPDWRIGLHAYLRARSADVEAPAGRPPGPFREGDEPPGAVC